MPPEFAGYVGSIGINALNAVERRVWKNCLYTVDANGNVKMPNVNMLIEMADMREANRSYEADLQMIKQARSMTSMMIDLLRSS